MYHKPLHRFLFAHSFYFFWNHIKCLKFALQRDECGKTNTNKVVWLMFCSWQCMKWRQIIHVQGIFNSKMQNSMDFLFPYSVSPSLRPHVPLCAFFLAPTKPARGITLNRQFKNELHLTYNNCAAFIGIGDRPVFGRVSLIASKQRAHFCLLKLLNCISTQSEK